MNREPIVAGQFYPASLEALRDQIESFVDSSLKKEKVKGVVSPHAGYIYSGKVAAEVFSKIEIPETIVLIGPSHTGIGDKFALYPDGSWETPLGSIEIDKELSELILKHSELITEDAKAHSSEHSIEVQLPIIQFFRKDFKIVPIAVAQTDIESCRKIAFSITKAIKDFKEQVLIVASSDMTHYEPAKSAKEKDQKAIDAIVGLDEELLFNRIGEYNISMCGYIPTVIMLAASKILGAKSAELINYMTSGDLSGDYDSVVGYAGVIVK